MNNSKNLKFLFFLTAIIILIGLVYASLSPPGGPPKTFFGNVYVNDGISTKPLSSGQYIVSAVINNQVVGQAKVINGYYSGLQVSTSDNYGTITFVINGIQANETSSWNNDQTDWSACNYKTGVEMGNLSCNSTNAAPFNLTLNQYPIVSTCGNGLVDLGEECDGLNLAGRTSCGTGWTGTISCSSTCVIDYSNCTQVSSGGSSGGGSSGGGGGGGSSSSSGGGGAGGSVNYISADNSGAINLSGLSAENSGNQGTANAVKTTNTSSSGIWIFIIAVIIAFIAIGIVYYKKRSNNYKKLGYVKKK